MPAFSARSTLLAFAATWITAVGVSSYPEMRDDIEQVFRFRQLAVAHPPVIPVRCSEKRGSVSPAVIHQDSKLSPCWMELSSFERPYPEVAAITDEDASERIIVPAGAPGQTRVRAAHASRSRRRGPQMASVLGQSPDGVRGLGVARAIIDGDRVRITGVRDFDYRSRNDFTVRYEEREVLLSHLTALDFFVSYWSEGPVGHTFLSFIFDNAPPLSISIETRPEVGEGFSPIASLFKQFELIYVVGDERDLARVRANYRGEKVYLYRLNTSANDARRLLLVYLARVNELADRPEFYHLLSNSCTINIIRYANAAGRAGRFDIRHLLNGWVDSYLYHSGRVDTTLPFEELRRRSLINEAAQAADGASDFSQRIRASLPTIPR